MYPWKKTESHYGLPIYINELTNEKQWDHPKFNEIRQLLDDCNYVRYSAYRVGMKFRVLQQSLWMDHVPLTVVAAVFERHKLGSTECGLHLDCYDLEAIIFDIYYACNKQSENSIDVEASTDLLLNLLLNIYDKDKTGKVQVLSSKLLLGVLSSSSLSDLYRFFFDLSSDHNNCITRLKLQILLKNITAIIDFIHEDANFGHHLIPSSTEDCFHNSPGLVGITESTFIAWLETGPPIISWLSILSRLKSAETVLHNILCSSCKLKPFVGLRYRCLKCNRYIQCQRCFFTGRTTNSHKLSHPMREYCSEANGNEKSQIFIRKIFGILLCSSNKKKSEPPDSHEKTTGTVNGVFIVDSPNDNVKGNSLPLSSPLSQLQLVIRQLEQHNRELNAIVSSGNRSAEEIKMYLTNHRSQVSVQIDKLKILKEYLNLPNNQIPRSGNLDKGHLQSTPVVSNGAKRLQKMEIGVLSPIAQGEENSRTSLYNDNRTLLHKESQSGQCTFDIKRGTEELSTMQYSINDISTWIGENPTQCQDIFIGRSDKSRGREMHSDLDNALAKLQQILANNFTLDESLGNYDNGQLKYAVSEVEGMLTSFIDTVETSRCSSVQPNPGFINKS